MSRNLITPMTRKGRAAGMVFAAVAAFAMVGAGPSQAQQQPKPPAQQQPAPQAGGAQPQAQQQNQDAWVKICEPIPGGENKDKKVCLTHHERIDGNTGIVVVSAAIRQIEGQDKSAFLVTVPLGMVLPNGAMVRVDEGKPVQLPYIFCHVGGCLAEHEATPEIIDGLKKGGKLGILVVNAASRKPLVYEIPLTGFTKAIQGPPVDSQKYRESRKQLLLAIRQRQIELAKKAADAAKTKEDGQQPQQPPKQ